MSRQISKLAADLYAAPVLLLSLTTLFWAGNAVAGQFAVGHITPFQLTFLRWAIVSAALWPLFGHEVRAHWSTVRPKLLVVVLMASLGFTGFNTLFYIASHYTGAVNIGILQGSMPALVLLGAFLVFGDRVTPVQLLGVLITSIGVVVVTSKGSLEVLLALGVNSGDLLMLVACALYSAYAVALKQRPAIPGRAFFTLMAPIAALAALPMLIVESAFQDASWPTLQGWITTLYVAAFPSCLAQLFFMRGVDLIGPGRAGVYVNLVPVFSAILAVLLLGERFAPFHGVALALVLGGIWLSQRMVRAAP